MNEPSTLRSRRSIESLQRDYRNGDKEPLEKVMRAWKGIQDIAKCEPNRWNSFFKIAGYHGEPFRGAGWGNAAWWGGYCNHGNVLFPTWHRAYLHEIEEAMRTVPGCEDVTLPYWDETGADSLANGVPWAFTVEKFEIDGALEDNPLKSYTFPRRIVDNIIPDPQTDYSKPSDYKTVRFPMSGLVGSPSDQAATKAHNALYPTDAIQTAYLCYNVQQWLNHTIDVGLDEAGKPAYVSSGVAWLYAKCLNAPNYTVFSNVSSAQQWNDDHTAIAPNENPNHDVHDEDRYVVPLESPHNSIHLAVGGFDLSAEKSPGGDLDLPFVTPLPSDIGANGDMGENDTASFDPIFFFHHCFVDRMFWLWQTIHHGKDGAPCTDRLETIDEYPGTNSVDSQGPTPGVAGGTWLTMNSPLIPFKPRDAEGKPVGDYYTSQDMADIRSLGYDYDGRTLDEDREIAQAIAVQGHGPSPLALGATTSPTPTPTLRVSGLNRAATPGSFVVSVFAPVKDASGAPVTDAAGNVKQQLVGHEAVLSRWHVQGCANCQTHLDVKAFVPLPGFTPEEARNTEFQVMIHTRSKAQPGQPNKLTLAGRPTNGRAVSARPIPASEAILHPAMVEPTVAPLSPVGGRTMLSLPVSQPSLVLRSVRLDVR